MKTIAIEDIATVFASEFLKEVSEIADKEFYYFSCREGITWAGKRVIRPDFLKMNYARRRKVVEKVLDKMLQKKG